MNRVFVLFMNCLTLYDCYPCDISHYSSNALSNLTTDSSKNHRHIQTTTDMAIYFKFSKTTIQYSNSRQLVQFYVFKNKMKKKRNFQSIIGNIRYNYNDIYN